MGVPPEVRNDDDAGFTRFVEVHSPRLLHLAHLLAGQDGEDLLQGVLVRAFPKWQRIEQDDPWGYVRQALVNAATDRWRRAGRARRRNGHEHAATAAELPDVASRAALIAALHGLGRTERAVIVLRYFEDLTEADTARILELPLSTVKSHHRRALLGLRVSEDLALDAADRAAGTRRHGSDQSGSHPA